MTDDNTADLTTDELLRMILARLDRLEAQAQAQAEERANTTRPLLDRAIAEMIQTRETLMEELRGVNKRLASIENRLEVFAVDISKIRGDVWGLDARVAALENRPPH
jgi:septal ring factor EnvC (AmiA/AmiB activator)